MAPAITTIAARLAPIKMSWSARLINAGWESPRLMTTAMVPGPRGERQRQGIEGLIDQARSRISLIGVFHPLVTAFLEEAPSGCIHQPRLTRPGATRVA